MPSVLAQVPLFAGFSRSELDALATFIRIRRYPKGSIVFHQGDPGTTLYLIEKGEVKLTVMSGRGKEATLALLGHGAFFGELSLLDGEPRSATAVARVDCTLGALDRDHLLRFLAEHPRATASLLSVLARRLRRTTDQVHDAVFLDIPARLAKVLLQFAEAQTEGPDGLLSPPKLTQEELAELVGGTRESINKCLGVFARQGWVRRHRGMVTVLKPEELRKQIY
ncbi:MAG TPA: Crp/Fnr family transcriptional regulator [bacterium]|nr:Crp/Fnr family transcriptional regulator [bacterium]